MLKNMRGLEKTPEKTQKLFKYYNLEEKTIC